MLLGKRRSALPAMMTVAGMLVCIGAKDAVAISNDTFARSKTFEKRTARASEEIGRYLSQLDRTEQALGSIPKAKEKDLRKRYTSFSGEYTKLQREQQHVTTEVNRLESTGAEYFVSWAQSNAHIADSGLQEASTNRRAAVLAERDALAASLSDVGSQLQSFMSKLHDLEEFLGADLSAANAAEASEMIWQSQADAQTLKDKIGIVEAKLRHFQSGTAE
ncbi:MAG TPA: DUF2959 family protein [Acidobacteriaceae bacterium]|nr:DUF2959 family protein [Acidobacteriaceae bacterium]